MIEIKKNTELKKMKIFLKIKNDEEDELLKALLDDAKQYILSYTRREKWLPELALAQVKIAIFEYKKSGTENIASQTVGEVSNTYNNEYPSEIFKILDKYRVARVVF